MVLNLQERLVNDTIRMRLDEKNALTYLKDHGNELSRTQYYRIKGRLEAEKLKRLHQIGQYGFVDQHLERIDGLELIERMCWENYWMEKNPYRRVLILFKITEIQPYLSAYYEATKEILKDRSRELSLSLPSDGRQATASNRPDRPST